MCYMKIERELWHRKVYLGVREEEGGGGGGGKFI